MTQSAQPASLAYVAPPGNQAATENTNVCLTSDENPAYSPVSSCFWEVVALRNVSFNVRGSEIVGYVGRIGSSNSTLLQTIWGHSGQRATVWKRRVVLDLGAEFQYEYAGRENVYGNANVLDLSLAETDGSYAALSVLQILFSSYASHSRPVPGYSGAVRISGGNQSRSDILILDATLAVRDELFQRKCSLRHGVCTLTRMLSTVPSPILTVDVAEGAVKGGCRFPKPGRRGL